MALQFALEDGPIRSSDVASRLMSYLWPDPKIPRNKKENHERQKCKKKIDNSNFAQSQSGNEQVADFDIND